MWRGTMKLRISALPFIFLAILLTTVSSNSTANEDDTPKESPSNASMYLPHAAHSGMWMFEYKYMRMFQSGMLNGSDSIDPKSVLHNPDYNKLPYSGSHDCTVETDPCLLTNSGSEMTMDMHMFMAMYHQTSDLSWMVMFNYLVNTMDMYDQMDANMPAETFSMDSSGIGDVQLFMTNKFSETEWFDISVTLGINLPLGSIDEPDGIQDMSGNEGIAPYDMQLGSGTYDIHTALTFEGVYYRFEYGAEIYKVTRTGLNSQFYNMGDSLKLSGWGRYTFPFGTQLRGGLAQRIWAPIEGRDERMSDNTRYSGGKRLELLLGAGQKYEDYMIYLDYAIPMLQHLNGVQMKTTGVLSLGLQYMYM